MSQHQHRAGELKDIGSFDLVEQLVTSIEFVKGLATVADPSQSPPAPADPSPSALTQLDGDTVWMGTDTRKIFIYAATTPEQELLLTTCSVPAAITQILYHHESVFVALANGCVQIFRRSPIDGQWLLRDPQTISLGGSTHDPVSHLLPINAMVYAGCGRKVWVINGITGEILKPFDVQHSNNNGTVTGGANLSVNVMAHSGIGLWVSHKNSSIICLYHTETFKHLQDINIASNVLRVTSSASSSQQRDHHHNSSVQVTALMACRGLLWVGTNVGISLTIPLPRLEGVPIISGGVNISYHAHFGPITFLLPLLPRAHSAIKPTTTSTTVEPCVEIVEPLRSSSPVLKKSDVTKSAESLVPPAPQPIATTNTEAPTKSQRKLEKQHSLDITSKLRATLTNSPVVLRRRRCFNKDEVALRTSKTLPRGLGSAAFFSHSIYSNASSSQASSGCDVYGLYGGLIFVKEDFEADHNQSGAGGNGGGGGSLMDPSYETLRRSDPELAAIPAKVSTLDRRLRMKVSRPRSLDLSNWSVDSRSSSLYTSSGSEESMAMRMLAANGGRSVSRNSSSASHKAAGSDLMNICENGGPTTHIAGHTAEQPPEVAVQSVDVTDCVQQPAITIENGSSCDQVVTPAKNKKKGGGKFGANHQRDAAPVVEGRRTLIVLMGGRGYINWRNVWYNTATDKAKNGGVGGGGASATAATPIISRVPNSNDAHIVIWEKKL